MASSSVVRVLEDVAYDNFTDYGGSDHKNGIILYGERQEPSDTCHLSKLNEIHG